MVVNLLDDSNCHRQASVMTWLIEMIIPIVSYSYTNIIGRKIINYKEVLQDINIEEYPKNPLTCDCSHFPFQYNPSGHVITGDLNII
jgi:hypothetical protein